MIYAQRLQFVESCVNPDGISLEIQFRTGRKFPLFFYINKFIILTAFLPNYPNPFNPETWMPYQLARPADVTVSIYTTDGRLVRTLDLGYQ